MYLCDPASNLKAPRIIRIIETIADFFVLNVVWVIACLPFITIFPATAALFAVVRGWQRGQHAGVLRPFLTHMRDQWQQRIWVGLLWGIVSGLIIFDYLVLDSLPPSLRAPMVVLLVVLSLLLATMTAFLFPAMAQFDLTASQLLRASLFLAITNPLTTLLVVLLVGSVGVLIWFLPPLSLMAGSVTAYCWYYLCQRVFDKIN